VLGTCHLSTGDLFRAAECHDASSPALRAAVEAMRRGELVSDDVVIELVREHGAALRCPQGFLLDGFPRTVAQAEALESILAEQGVALDAVLCYDLPLEEILVRLGGRRTCSACNAVYHETAAPPRVEGRCDLCGGQLVQREDDRPESIRVRMQAYDASTRPLMEYYRRAGKLLVVSAHGTPDAVMKRSLRALKRRMAEPMLP
jgi:adenylate kinase